MAPTPPQPVLPAHNIVQSLPLLPPTDDVSGINLLNMDVPLGETLDPGFISFINSFDFSDPSAYTMLGCDATSLFPHSDDNTISTLGSDGASHISFSYNDPNSNALPSGSSLGVDHTIGSATTSIDDALHANDASGASCAAILGTSSQISAPDNASLVNTSLGSIIPATHTIVHHDNASLTNTTLSTIIPASHTIAPHDVSALNVSNSTSLALGVGHTFGPAATHTDAPPATATALNSHTLANSTINPAAINRAVCQATPPNSSISLLADSHNTVRRSGRPVIPTEKVMRSSLADNSNTMRGKENHVAPKGGVKRGNRASAGSDSSKRQRRG